MNRELGRSRFSILWSFTTPNYIPSGLPKGRAILGGRSQVFLKYKRRELLSRLPNLWTRYFIQRV
ncbi:hypothetical protein NG796_22555 [Laspinema sp. A4]|uniref:hypothetical protein n=1 Tax=Laspinema sp. D2d TaxID=2953686 RepID=UPI0021BAFE5D|nr:hypothetical protein [Laspinema sp. D2d]MCT7986062.1 hypothetical protein [Laspinema sp. D2d]